MTKYRFTQFGTFSVAIMLPIFLFSCYMLIKALSSGGEETAPLIFVTVILLITLLTFYQITIIIDDKSVSFRMGIGLLKRSFPVSAISGCTVVRNFPLTGFGIRRVSNGWLYNVSGLNAVELSFKNRNSIVRIGTDKPYEVAEAINKLIGREVHGMETFEKETGNKLIPAALLSLVLVLTAFILLYGSRETRVETDGASMKISGMYGMTINYSDIAAVDTLSLLPPVGLRTNGFSLGSTLKGNFSFKDHTRARLYIKKGLRPYIRIMTNDKPVWINFSDAAKTISLYQKLKIVTSDTIH